MKTTPTVFSSSDPRWLVRLVLAGVLFFLLIPGGIAAERKPWTTFTNCQLVASTDGDGDSFRVRSGTNEFNVRLYFVDAPESNLRYPERTREQSEYFGITLDDTIKAGKQAGEAVRELLREPFVVHTRWAAAGGRGKEPRYYCFVEVGGTNLAELLVAQGWARTKGVVSTLPSGEKSKSYGDKLRALETTAREKGLGAWSYAAHKKSEPAPE